MLSKAEERRIDEMTAIAEELGATVTERGWTKYALKILARLQNLSIGLGNEERMDAKLGDIAVIKSSTDITPEEKAQGFYYRTVNGNVIKFNSETQSPVEGQPKALGVDSFQDAINSTKTAIIARREQARERDERQRKHPRKGYMVCEEVVAFSNHGEVTKDRRGRDVTHFNHDEEKMEITSNIKVEDPSGNAFEIVQGSIQHLTVFASHDVGRGLDAANGLSEQVGGSPESWKHCKGIGKVVGEDGVVREADIHWFESRECGQLEWKIKQFVEDMDESEVYW